VQTKKTAAARPFTFVVKEVVRLHRRARQGSVTRDAGGAGIARRSDHQSLEGGLGTFILRIFGTLASLAVASAATAQAQTAPAQPQTAPPPAQTAPAEAPTFSLGTLQSWLAQPTASGDWGGLRPWLLSRGINFQLWYTGEAGHNVTPGYHGIGTDAAQTVAFGADVDLGKLANDPYGTFRFWLTDRAGRNLNADRLGSLFQTFETYGQGQDFRLNEVSFAQGFDGDVFNAKAGFYPMGKDFGSLPAFCAWISNAWCGHPLVMPYDSGWDDDPSGRWGGRIRYTPNPLFSIQTGIYQVNPTYTQVQNGFKINFQGNTGVLYPLEATLYPYLNPRLPGEYKIGGYFDTSKAPDEFNPSREDRGRMGFYLEGQQKVFAVPDNPTRGLTLSSFYAAGDENTSEMKQTWHFGFTWEGTFPGRDLDTINLGWVAATINSRLVERERDEGKPLQAATESLIELNYNIVLGPWLNIRPGVQYDANPSGYESRPNAWVLVVQTKVIF
jgi:porin